MRISSVEELNAARATCAILTAELPLPSQKLDGLAFAMEELGQNFLRYAAGGTLAVAHIQAPYRGIELFAQDQGPGIPELARLFENEQAKGLGKVKRLADEFDICSGPQGTHVRFVVYA